MPHYTYYLFFMQLDTSMEHFKSRGRGGRSGRYGRGGRKIYIEAGFFPKKYQGMSQPS